MKSYKSFFILVLLFACFQGFIACEDDDDPDIECTSHSLSVKFSSELSAVNNASAAYNNDPSQANCENYLAALQTYINALQSYQSCAIQQGYEAEWESAINGAEHNKNLLNC